MRFIKIIVLALIFVVALVLIIQNQEVFTHKFELKLDLLVYQIGPYIATNLVLVVVAFLIGVIFAIIWGAFHSVTLRAELREKDRRIKELEKQQRREVVAPSFSNSPSPTETGKPE
ncbi:MAG TPA: LapA family protein [Thermodesulfobacteriota bacterium]|jgi:uncharacterized membrane protein YciS (DUF1049 family)|nr:LapA family protein [Thermodesulfobacteriota bacterium]